VHACSAQMRPIATDVTCSVVYMHVCLSVCLCVGHMAELCSCAKMAELIEMPFWL